MTAQDRLLAAAAELRKTDPNLTQPEAIAKAAEQDPSLHDAVLREAGIPWEGDREPPRPPEPVGKSVQASPEEEAAARLDELVSTYASAAGISKVDAFPIVVQSKEGATYAAACYRESGDLQRAGYFHEVSKRAPAFFEIAKAAEGHRDRAALDRLLEAAR